MSKEILVKLEVNKHEADFIIAGLAECKYKEVYIPISHLRKQKVKSVDDVSSVVLTLWQAQTTLNVLLDRPFRDVYKLVAKINEQINIRSDDSSIEKAADNKEKLSDSKGGEIEVQARTEVSASTKKNHEVATADDQAETLGKPVSQHRNLLEKLSAQKRNIA